MLKGGHGRNDNGALDCQRQKLARFLFYYTSQCLSERLSEEDKTAWVRWLVNYFNWALWANHVAEKPHWADP